MSPSEINNKLKSGEDLLIIDVRESFELEICKLEDALHIPMMKVPFQLKKIPQDKELIVMCHHGVRSLRIVNYLKAQGISNVFNMDGGIDRWAKEVDNKMNKY